MQDDQGFIDPATVEEDEDQARDVIKLKKQGAKKRA